MTHQFDFLVPGGGTPEGLRYRPGVVETALEAKLLGQFRGLPLAEFEFRAIAASAPAV